MRALPTGTYTERDTCVHRMDSRVKLLVFIAGIAAIVLCPTWWLYVVILALFALVGRAAHLNLREFVMPLRRLWAFIALVFAMNCLFFGEGDLLFSAGPIRVTLAGVEQGARIAFNVALVVVWGNMLTTTTSPVALTDALESLFKPLGLLHVPTKTLSLIVSVAIQFIPTLLEETAAIRKAQIARGAQFESKNLLRKARAVVPLVVPVFVSAFRRADELATAMEARGDRG